MGTADEARLSSVVGERRLPGPPGRAGPPIGSVERGLEIAGPGSSAPACLRGPRPAGTHFGLPIAPNFPSAPETPPFNPLSPLHTRPPRHPSLTARLIQGYASCTRLLSPTPPATSQPAALSAKLEPPPLCDAGSDPAFRLALPDQTTVSIYGINQAPSFRGTPPASGCCSCNRGLHL